MLRPPAPRGAGALPLGLLFAALVPAGPAGAAPPLGFRGMPAMRGGMTVPAPQPTTMMNRSTLMVPGMGPSQTSFRQMAFSPPGSAPSSATQGRYGAGSPAMNSGGGSSGGGMGFMPSGTPMTSPGLDPAGGVPASYVNPYGTYGADATAQRSPQDAPGGPLLGLLNAGGGLDWPLALRVLPPGLETRALRQQLDARAGEIERQAAAGPVAPGLLRDANRDVDRLRGILADRGAYLPVSQQAATEARRFLQKLSGALKAVP